MALWIAPDTMREARVGAPSAVRQLCDRHVAAGGHHGSGHVEGDTACVGRAGDIFDTAADTGCHLFELILAEFIAAGSDRRTQHGSGDRFGERIERRLHHSLGQPAPAGVHHGELGLGADQHHGGAVGGPTTDHDVIETREGDVADRAVTHAAGVDGDHPDAMALIELCPRQVDDGATTGLEFFERDIPPVEVTMGARRAPDLQVATRSLGDRGRCDAVT